MSEAPSVAVVELCGGYTLPHAELSTAFGEGPWLLISPHDDDFVLGVGLTTIAAVRAGIDVHVAVLTDGALGYATLEEREGLSARRTSELAQSAEKLGLSEAQVHRFEFPDGSLMAHQGCRGPTETPTVGQRLVALMRSLRPQVVFVCTPTDVHPDHRVAASETAMAVVWAAARIWLELGEPIAPPQVFYYAIYAPFDGAPELEVCADAATLEQKLSALSAFASQGVIEPMIDRFRADGPFEYLRRAHNEPYRPRLYRTMFAKATEA